MHNKGGVLVCTDCGQTKTIKPGRKPRMTPEGEIAPWHTCDPEKIGTREKSNDLLRTVTHLAGQPIKIGGLDAQGSAQKDFAEGKFTLDQK